MALGEVTMDHAVPFQCSMIVLFPGRPFEPTAQMLFAATASTPLRKLSAPEMGLGLATIDHLFPFQCSISVRLWPPAAV